MTNSFLVSILSAVKGRRLYINFYLFVNSSVCIIEGYYYIIIIVLIKDH